MNSTDAPVSKARPGQPPEPGDRDLAGSRSRVGPWLWPLGILLIALALGSGTLIEGRLREAGMPGLTADAAARTDQLMPLLFAFGFPLGVALLALAAQATPIAASPWRRGLSWVLAGIAVTAPIAVPAIAGRDPAPGYFGSGGVMIALCALLSLWQLGRIRGLLPPPLTRAADLLIGALGCFAIAAWNLCGSAAMPSFLLEPQRVLDLGTLPFAIGQMKTVMALLAAGWLLVLLAAWSALRYLRAGQGSGR